MTSPAVYFLFFLVFFINCMPFIGFGFLDNAIMILAVSFCTGIGLNQGFQAALRAK